MSIFLISISIKEKNKNSIGKIHPEAQLHATIVAVTT